MDELMSNPAFQTYAVCSSILVIKMMLSGNYTTFMRFQTRRFASAEDVAAFGGSTDQDPSVVRAMRIQSNDGENILPFLAIGLIYVLSGATAFGATVYFWTFTVARLLHTVAYTAGLQPWRAIFYGVGYLCILGMAVQIIF